MRRFPDSTVNTTKYQRPVASADVVSLYTVVAAFLAVPVRVPAASSPSPHVPPPTESNGPIATTFVDADEPEYWNHKPSVNSLQPKQAPAPASCTLSVARFAPANSDSALPRSPITGGGPALE